MGPSLATKISVAIFGVLALALMSSLAAIRSAYRFEELQQTLVADNLESVRAAEELEIALLEQRGHVSSYLLDNGNRKWLTELEQRRKEFDSWLHMARRTARSDTEREILDELQVVQAAYAQKRDTVVQLYNAGKIDEARQALLQDVPALYREAYELCEKFIAANQTLVDKVSEDVRRRVEQTTLYVTGMLFVTMALGFALLWMLFQGVIFPLRRIAQDVRSAAGEEANGMPDSRSDEMRELRHYVQLLMTNVTETRSDLERSRTQLEHADKLAAVGKIAASVAHEIRNPLTSMKMWLFSLRRTVGTNTDAQQKIDVISEEISRLENVVRNFLEFAKPPKLKVQRHSVGSLIDKTLELLQHPLIDQGITVERHSDPGLPDVLVDVDQLKQVFLNLISNAIDAMPQGGVLRVDSQASERTGQPMIVVRISDSGSGIPIEEQDRVFEPFFTTKQEGTGLGLCIAASIMARHAGALELETSNAMGTHWAVWIPVGDTAGSSGGPN